MNAAEHKAAAEAILNRINDSTVMYPERLLQAAQIHATLATIPDAKTSDDGKLGYM